MLKVQIDAEEYPPEAPDFPTHLNFAAITKVTTAMCLCQWYQWLHVVCVASACVGFRSVASYLNLAQSCTTTFFDRQAEMLHKSEQLSAHLHLSRELISFRCVVCI